jgi:hypothetical protein
MNQQATRRGLARLALLPLVAGCASLPPGGLEPHRAALATPGAETAAPGATANTGMPRETSITSVRLDSASYWTLTRETKQ